MATLIETILDTLRVVGVEPLSHAAIYRFRKAWAEARWDSPGRPRRGLDLWHAFRRKFRHPFPVWPRRWQGLGDVQGYERTERGLVVEAERGRIELLLFAPDLVRVRYLPYESRAPEPLPYAIARPLEAWPRPGFELLEQEEALLLSTGRLTVGVLREGARVFHADARTGRLLRADVDVGWGPEGALRHRTALAPGESLFGLGERATEGNRRGQTHTLWNLDPAGYEVGDDPINLNIPVYVGLVPESGAESGSYLVFYENPYYAEFDLGEKTPNVADHRFDGGELRYYLAAGPVPRLLERYTALTGRHDLPPLWFLGYQQSRWSYVPEARVRRLVQDFETHEVPCDVIYLDIDYMEGFRVFSWDEAQFDLPQLAADLREKGYRLIPIVDPGVKQDPDYEVYREGLAGGHFVTLPDGEVFHAPVWPGLCAFPDFTAPATRAWWGNLYGRLLDAGVAGIWNDMNEPAVFAQSGDPTLPDVACHALEGRGGTHREAHNLYGVQMVRACREGLLRLRSERRPVVITRAGWAGVQRHAVSWTADNASTWSSLRLTVPVLVGLGLSGLPYTGPDVGGFAGAADGELFTRWLQMAIFMPFLRSHTVVHTPDQEPWSYGEPYLSINRRFIQLRYELLPYLYTGVWQMVTRGWPLVRPLWWDEQGNAALWEAEDAFLCGDALFVAPVVEPGATRREVTLPAGAWYDFWTDRVREGGRAFEQVAPLETLPLFVREGTVLPLGEVGPNVENRPDKFLRLDLYPLREAGEATSWLYEDAGEGFGYLQGDRRVSRFVMRREAAELQVAWEREGGYRPPYEHVALTLHGLDRAPRLILVDGEEFRPALVDPVKRSVLLGVPPFERLEITL